MTAAAPRESSRSAVLATLLERRELDRAHLVAATGLSQATVFRVVDELMQDSLAVEGTRHSRGGPGRTARGVRANPRYSLVAGIDLGSDRCRIVLADALGETVARRESTTPRGSSALELAEWLADRVRHLVSDSGGGAPVNSIAVALPGIVDADGERVLASRNLERVEGEAFLRHFRHLVRVPVAVDNDSSLALLGELRFGAVDRDDTTALVTMGAGMGVAIAMGGRVLSGAHGLLGEFERLPLPGSGLRFKDLLSETGLIERFGDSALDRLLTGSGDRAVLDETCAALVYLIAIVELAYDPRTVLVTGSLADRLGDEALARVAADAGATVDATADVRRAALGEAAVELGAMSLALGNLYIGMGVAARDAAGISADRDAALSAFSRHEPVAS